jgi:hypothetical protein
VAAAAVVAAVVEMPADVMVVRDSKPTKAMARRTRRHPKR